jgi:hypothetical protein
MSKFPVVANAPQIEDCATIEGYCNGFPIYAFDYTHVCGVGPYVQCGRARSRYPTGLKPVPVRQASRRVASPWKEGSNP